MLVVSPSAGITNNDRVFMERLHLVVKLPDEEILRSRKAYEAVLNGEQVKENYAILHIENTISPHRISTID